MMLGYRKHCISGSEHPTSGWRDGYSERPLQVRNALVHYFSSRHEILYSHYDFALML